MNVYEYASHPNQRKITVKKESIKDGDFLTLNRLSFEKALCDLTHGALRLYLYLSGNADNFEFWLSKSHLCNTTGLSRSSYKRAFAELMQKGYIIGNNNSYIFYESPRKRGPV